MDWINLHIPTVIRSPAFIGSSPAERGTWVCVLAYACEIECGGRLLGAALWKDRQWQQACGVTMREVRAADRLLQVDGDDIVVNGYPQARQKQVAEGRKNALAGSMARWGKTPPNGTPVDDGKGMGKGSGKGMGKPNAEGEGEGEGEGEEVAASPSSTPTLDREDLTTPTDLAPAKRVAHGLGTWVAYHARDAERKAENLAQIDELVGRYGAQVVQAAAERIVARKSEKAWPNELLPEILASANPAPAGGDQPHVAHAKRLVEKHGWERCRDSMDLPMLKNADEVVHCMVCEGRCLDLVVATLGDA